MKVIKEEQDGYGEKLSPGFVISTGNNVHPVGDKALNAEDRTTFCDEEPAYRRKQDTHRERERH